MHRGLYLSLAFCGFLLGQSHPPTIEQAWDALLPNALPAQATPRPAGASSENAADFQKHFFFESRTEYQRYSTTFTGLPTIAGVINAPIIGIFNPAGIPYPDAFQPSANRLFGYFDWGTRGWLSDRLNTHFGFRYDQDLTHVDAGAPAAGFLETFPANRRLELTEAVAEFQASPGVALSLGRQTIGGAEIAQLDGGAVTVTHGSVTATLFAGRRFTYFSDPSQRAIGGANLLFRLGQATTVEYDGLWYIRGSQRVTLRTRLAKRWLLATYFRAYGGAPVDFSAQAYYANAKSNLRLSFFQKLSEHDYFYDYTYFANSRLYLGALQPYSQFTIEGQRTLTRSLGLGASVWIRRLNSASDQGPFDTSFEDYRAHANFLLARKWLLFAEYHQHNSDRIAPGSAIYFDDISLSGETSVKDISAEVRRSFKENRFGFNGGAYYRRISLQDKYFLVDNQHQSGFLSGAWLKVDTHSRIFADYSLDNDFFLFRPDLANSRMLRLGMSWKY